MATYASPADPSVRRVFNRKVARALGIAIPRSLLRTDRIIE